MTHPFAELETILNDRYSASLMSSPVEAIVWAAERLSRTVGILAAGKQLSAANKARERAGKMPAYIPFGHPLFGKGRC